LNPIEAHALTKQFGKLTAVNNLDLQIAQGEFFGFIGPNGAGKTTTLQMLSGQLPPTSGTAAILGIDAAADPIPVKAAGPYFSAPTSLNWQRNYATGWASSTGENW
jgi:ABC-2 type transport system ATP-binding protein